jgi:hypothetical protein
MPRELNTQITRPSGVGRLLEPHSFGVDRPPIPAITHYTPAHIHQVGTGSSLTERQHWFLSYTFPSRLPDPHPLAVPARPVVVRATSRPPQRLPGQTALSFNPAATTTRRRSPLTPAQTHRASRRTVSSTNHLAPGQCRQGRAASNQQRGEPLHPPLDGDVGVKSRSYTMR